MGVFNVTKEPLNMRANTRWNKEQMLKLAHQRAVSRVNASTLEEKDKPLLYALIFETEMTKLKRHHAGFNKA